MDIVEILKTASFSKRQGRTALQYAIILNYFRRRDIQTDKKDKDDTLKKIDELLMDLERDGNGIKYKAVSSAYDDDVKAL